MRQLVVALALALSLSCEDDVELFPLPAAGIASMDCGCALELPASSGLPIICTVLTCECDAVQSGACAGPDADDEACRERIANAVDTCDVFLGGTPDRPDVEDIDVGSVRSVCELFSESGCTLEFEGSFCTSEELNQEDLERRCYAVCEAAGMLVEAELGSQSEQYSCGSIGVRVDPGHGRKEECGLECPEVACSATNMEECTVVQVEGDARCSGGFTSEPFCRAPDEDPPTLHAGGILAEMTTRRSHVEVDHSSSTFHIDLDDDHSVTVALDGTVDLIGEPCDGCPVSLRVSLHGDDTSVDDTILSEIYVAAGTGTTPVVALDTSGDGTIATSALSGTFSMSVGGERGFLTTTNASPLEIHVDREGRSLSVSGEIQVSGSEQTFAGTLSLEGTIVNQPPWVDTDVPAVVECTSPEGAAIPLVGTARDRDGDLKLLRLGWHEGLASVAPGGGTLLGSAPAASPIRPLGEHTFSFLAFDDRLQRDAETIAVNVVDTTAPSIVSHENVGPTCLWAPAHDLVVVRVDRDLRAVIDEACDPAPELLIVDAQSSQPDDGIGDGATSDDVRFFSDRVCLRAERSGTDLEGRRYFVRLAARDASGNMSEPVVEIIASPHDQRPSTRCERLATIEEASENSPECALQAGDSDNTSPSGEAAIAAPGQVRAEKMRGRGCAGAPDASLAILVAMIVRRRK